jgi:hypothetical protein
MKFVSVPEQTKCHLEEWAGDKKLVIANFYFWTASTHQSQKSQCGLLRTILYQILRQCPDLIQLAYHNEYTLMTSDGKVSYDSLDELLTVPSLLDRLRKISTSTISDTKFCFFLDGLDEYDGKPADIIELVDILNAFQNVKVCVSSRPWNEFEDHFGHQQSRKLYMQDLTRDDIRLHVEETLGSNTLFQQLRWEDSQCPDFVQNIVNAADGVFLWVFLVVRSLLEGLTNSDRIKDLQQRLNETPKGLEDYFEAILFSTENRYRPQTARILSVAIRTSTELPLMAYWVIDQDDEEKRLLSSRAECPGMPLLKSRVERMRRRLKVLGKGLLEVSYSDYDSEEDFLWDKTVTFLHRTVKDYLQTPNAMAMLESWWQDQAHIDWDIFSSLGILATMAPSPTFDGGAKVWHYCIDFFFIYARRLDGNPKFRNDTSSILDRLQKLLEPAFKENLESIYTRCRDNSRFLCTTRQDEFLEPDLFILSSCTCAGLFNYVSYKFENDRKLFARVTDQVHTIYWSVLADSIVGAKRRSVGLEWDTSMLQLLLASGADPNPIGAKSAWRSEWMTILTFLDGNGELSAKFEAIKLLVKYGARWDTHSGVSRLNRKERDLTAATLLKSSLSADQFSVLEDIVNRRDRKYGQQIFKRMENLKLWAKSKR